MSEDITEDPFSVIAPFLKRMEGEVGGRSSAEPDGSAKALLLKFAAGNCADTEVEKMVSLLESNPDWVPFLADYVKEARG